MTEIKLTDCINMKENKYSKQKRIAEYLRRVAMKYGVTILVSQQKKSL